VGLGVIAVVSCWHGALLLLLLLVLVLLSLLLLQPAWSLKQSNDAVHFAQHMQCAHQRMSHLVTELLLLLLLQLAWVFNKPVDTVQFADYLQYVTQAMDFGTMLQKVDAKQYDEPAEVCAGAVEGGLFSCMCVCVCV
jgi:di/tricarboxylate transporter